MDAEKKKKLMIAGGVVLGLVVLYFLYQMLFGAKTTDTTTDAPPTKPTNATVQPDGTIVTRFETKPQRANGSIANKYPITKAQFDGKARLMEQNIRQNVAWLAGITQGTQDASNIDIGGLDVDTAVKVVARDWTAGSGHDGNAFYYIP